MKCVWDIVSVHVSLHGISDCRCCYTVSANEFCQRQLWTWWNGQRRNEELALCSLGRCGIVTPASFYTPCLTYASCPEKISRPPFHYPRWTRGRVICSGTFALFIFHVPNLIPMCQALSGRGTEQSDASAAISQGLLSAAELLLEWARSLSSRDRWDSNCGHHPFNKTLDLCCC